MSLINDALKRARAAQKDAPPPAPPTLHFRPVEAQDDSKRRPNFMIPAAVGALVVFVFFLGWHLTHRSRATAPENRGELVVNARAAQPATIASSAAPRLAATQAAAQSLTNILAKSSGQNSALAPVNDRAGAPTPTDSSTNSAAIEALVVKPAPLKLQAIFFQPARPSALISGKTVFRGDKLGEFRVLAIDKTSATLASSSLTNILTVGE